MTQSTEVSTSLNVDEVFAALETWIKQKPGLDPRDYAGAWSVYRSELRNIGKDRKRALIALDEARNLQPQKPAILADSFRAFSGRLQLVIDRDRCFVCGAGISEPKYSRPYQGNDYSICSATCAVADIADARMPHRLTYTTGQYWPTEYRKAAASVLETYIAAWRQAYASEHPVTFEYRTMDDVISANRQIGGHWFDRSTMRFFNTKIESGAVAIHDEAGRPTRARFITSEKGPDGIREYSIREAQPDGTIDTVGEFQQYRTRDAARAALLRER